ncbi:MAG TPA: hypothetical protein VMM56_00950 [Planctomycetaceae bacterium]|nr:hypothetical protein [Planctomycetaceae bacterium]
MWSVIPSMDGLLQGLMLAFTQPSFDTHQQLFLGWLMCFGRRTEFRVFEAIDGAPVDRFYNFFSRSAWTVRELAQAVARQPTDSGGSLPRSGGWLRGRLSVYDRSEGRPEMGGGNLRQPQRD